MKDNILNVDFWDKALARGIRTFCQTFIGMVTVGQAFSDVDWRQILSVCGVAALISLAMSIVAGIPESQQEIGPEPETVLIEEYPDEEADTPVESEE